MQAESKAVGGSRAPGACLVGRALCLLSHGGAEGAHPLLLCRWGREESEVEAEF